MGKKRRYRVDDHKPRREPGWCDTTEQREERPAVWPGMTVIVNAKETPGKTTGFDNFKLRQIVSSDIVTGSWK